MTAQLIDGKALADELRQSLPAWRHFAAKGHSPPGGHSGRRNTRLPRFTKNKVNGCLAIGMHPKRSP